MKQIQYDKNIICVSKKLSEKLINDFDIQLIKITDENKYCFTKFEIQKQSKSFDKKSPIHFSYGLIFGTIIGLLQIYFEWNIYLSFIFFSLIVNPVNLLYHGIKYRYFNIVIAVQHRNAIFDMSLQLLGYILAFIIFILI